MYFLPNDEIIREETARSESDIESDLEPVVEPIKNNKEPIVIEESKWNKMELIKIIVKIIESEEFSTK